MHQLPARSGIILACLPALLVAACGGSGDAQHTPSGAAVAGPSSNAAAGNPNVTESAPPGDIPDNQAFVPYHGSGFTVTVPEGWARTRQGTATVFTDKYNGIRIDQHSAATAPTVSSATATELPAIKAASHGFVPGSVTTVSRNAGSVVKITYRADSAPNPVTGKVILQAVERYEFWHAGKEIVLTLSSSLGSDNVDPWRTVTDSLTWSA